MKIKNSLTLDTQNKSTKNNTGFLGVRSVYYVKSKNQTAQFKMGFFKNLIKVFMGLFGKKEDYLRKQIKKAIHDQQSTELDENSFKFSSDLETLTDTTTQKAQSVGSTRLSTGGSNNEGVNHENEEKYNKLISLFENPGTSLVDIQEYLKQAQIYKEDPIFDFKKGESNPTLRQSLLTHKKLSVDKLFESPPTGMDSTTGALGAKLNPPTPPVMEPTPSKARRPRTKEDYKEEFDAFAKSKVGDEILPLQTVYSQMESKLSGEETKIKFAGNTSGLWQLSGTKARMKNGICDIEGMIPAVAIMGFLRNLDTFVLKLEEEGRLTEEREKALESLRNEYQGLLLSSILILTKPDKAQSFLEDDLKRVQEGPEGSSGAFLSGFSGHFVIMHYEKRDGFRLAFMNLGAGLSRERIKDDKYPSEVLAGDLKNTQGQDRCSEQFFKDYIGSKEFAKRVVETKTNGNEKAYEALLNTLKINTKNENISQTIFGRRQNRDENILTTVVTKTEQKMGDCTCRTQTILQHKKLVNRLGEEEGKRLYHELKEHNRGQFTGAYREDDPIAIKPVFYGDRVNNTFSKEQLLTLEFVEAHKVTDKGMERLRERVKELPKNQKWKGVILDTRVTKLDPYNKKQPWQLIYLTLEALFGDKREIKLGTDFTFQDSEIKGTLTRNEAGEVFLDGNKLMNSDGEIEGNWPNWLMKDALVGESVSVPSPGQNPTSTGNAKPIPTGGQTPGKVDPVPGKKETPDFKFTLGDPPRLTTKQKDIRADFTEFQSLLKENGENSSSSLEPDPASDIYNDHWMEVLNMNRLCLRGRKDFLTEFKPLLERAEKDLSSEEFSAILVRLAGGGTGQTNILWNGQKLPYYQFVFSYFLNEKTQKQVIDAALVAKGAKFKKGDIPSINRKFESYKRWEEYLSAINGKEEEIVRKLKEQLQEADSSINQSINILNNKIEELLSGKATFNEIKTFFRDNGELKRGNKGDDKVNLLVLSFLNNPIIKDKKILWEGQEVLLGRFIFSEIIPIASRIKLPQAVINLAKEVVEAPESIDPKKAERSEEAKSFDRAKSDEDKSKLVESWINSRVSDEVLFKRLEEVGIKGDHPLLLNGEDKWLFRDSKFLKAEKGTFNPLGRLIVEKRPEVADRLNLDRDFYKDPVEDTPPDDYLKDFAPKVIPAKIAYLKYLRDTVEKTDIFEIKSAQWANENTNRL